MTIQEQQHIKQKGYSEAMRYIASAREEFKKAGKSFKHPKYVNSARGIAYKGVLVALETLLQLKGVEIPKYTVDKENQNFNNFGFYNKNFRKLGKKLLWRLCFAYESLYKSNYLYDDPRLLRKGILDRNFEIANEIVNRIKPLQGKRNFTQEVT